MGRNSGQRREAALGQSLEMRREGSFWEDLGSSGAKVIVKRRTGESLLPNPPALAPDKTTSKSREDVEGVGGGQSGRHEASARWDEAQEPGERQGIERPRGTARSGLF